MPGTGIITDGVIRSPRPPQFWGENDGECGAGTMDWGKGREHGRRLLPSSGALARGRLVTLGVMDGVPTATGDPVGRVSRRP